MVQVSLALSPPTVTVRRPVKKSTDTGLMEAKSLRDSSSRTNGSGRWCAKVCFRLPRTRGGWLVGSPLSRKSRRNRRRIDETKAAISPPVWDDVLALSYLLALKSFGLRFDHY